MLVSHIYCGILWRKVIISELYLLGRKPAFIIIRLFPKFNFWKKSQFILSEILKVFWELFSYLYSLGYSIIFFIQKLKQEFWFYFVFLIKIF